MKVERIGIEWHPRLSIYASERYLKIVSDEYGWLGGMDDSGRCRCVLPYSIIKKPFIKLARFRVETIPCVEDFSIEEEKSFLHSAVRCLGRLGADLIIPATTSTIFRTYPEGAVAASYGTYLIDLTLPEETLWMNMHPNHRNKVRSAQKSGIEIRNGNEQAGTAYQLIKDTLRQSRLGFMKFGEFKRLVDGLDGNIEILLAYYQGAAQACVVVPYSTHCAYFLYSGRRAESATGVVNLLKWESIRHFRGLGVERFNLVGVRISPEKGSKQEGLLNSKKRFGGKLVQGYMWKFAINPIQYAVYSLAVRLQRRGDIVDHEKKRLDMV